MDTVVIQSSVGEVIRDVHSGTLEEDQFWIKWHPSSTEGVDAVVKVTRDHDQDGVKLTSDKLKIHQTRSIHEFELEVGDKLVDLRIPRAVYATSRAEITAVGAWCEHIALGDTNGALTFGTWSTGFQKILTVEDAHFADIVKLLFFPSGKVVLTAGLDLQIKIWGFETGESPRTMTKHTARITDLAIVGRGRNFLSCSLDGSILVWECGSGLAIDEMRRVKDLRDPVYCMCLTEDKTSVQHQQQYRFYEMEGKVLYAGHKSGVISSWDMANRLPLGDFVIDDSAVTTIATDNKMTRGEFHLYAGYASGMVRCWSSRNRVSPVFEVRVAQEQLEDPQINDIQVCNESLIVTYARSHIAEISLASRSLQRVYTGLEEGMLINQTVSTEKGLVAVGRYGLFARF